MNLLLDENIKAEIEEVVGEVTNFELNVIWDTITNHLGYELSLQERFERIRGTFSNRVYLSCRPVIELLELRVNRVLQNNNDFVIYNNALIDQKRIFGGTFRYAFNDMAEVDHADELQIKYNAGYTVETLPFQIKKIVIMMINDFRFATSEERGLTGYKIDTISYNYKSIIEKSTEIAKELETYKAIIL